MATQKGQNVQVYAVQGNFDDAQTGVKKVFADADVAAELEKRAAEGAADLGGLKPLDGVEDALPIDRVSKASTSKRQDLRGVPFVTIDGEDARDFDDAVYVRRLPGAPDGAVWELWVAIADVSHFVLPGSRLDREARDRGNSYYFPTSVEPMLPEVLSNGLCSLRPDEDRLVMAARVGFDDRGIPRTSAFFPGVIRSRGRLTYEGVQEALDHGMTLGLMQDMAVGVHGLGADAWANPERFASGGVTVGCPPDFYNQQGQDWGQPPFNPRYLEATGYQVYREMVHSMYEHAGAVRIDHVLGLFRLWWIPQGLGARNGAYVTYNHEAMLGVLAIEATRAGGMVVGEDLGTVPDYVRRILADHGVLGTDVEWFNRVDDSPNAGDPYRAPKDYRKQALASVTTHDLPPTAGYLNFAHVKLREERHLLSEPVEAFAASAMAERTAMMNRLVENGYISQTVADDVEGHVQEIVEAMHAMLTDTPSLLLQAALADGVGECRSQNQPGTSREYSNWRVPLADSSGHVVHTDEVFDLPRVQSLAAVMRREKR